MGVGVAAKRFGFWAFVLGCLVALMAMSTPLRAEPVMIDPGADMIDVTSEVQTVDPSQLPEGIVTEDGIQEIEWFVVDLKNPSGENITRIVRFVTPGPGRFSLFGGGSKHIVYQVTAKSEGTTGEPLIPIDGLRYSAVRVVIPAPEPGHETLSIAFGIADASSEASVEVWDEQAFNAAERNEVVRATLLAGILLASAIYLLAVSLLGHAQSASIAAGAMATACLALLAHDHALGAVLFFGLVASESVAAAFAGATVVLMLMYARDVLSLGEVEPTNDRFISILIMAVGGLSVVALTGLPGTRTLAALALVVGVFSGVYVVGRLAWYRVEPASRYWVSTATIGAAVLFGMMDALWLGRLWSGFGDIAVMGLTAGLALIAFAAGPAIREPARWRAPAPRTRLATVQSAEPAGADSRYALALMAAHQGMWDWDIATGRLFVSPSVEHLLGVDPGELKWSERLWADRIHPEDREIYENALENYRAQGNVAFSTEYRIRHADTSFRWLQLRASCIAESGSSSASRCIGVISDVTSRKAQESRLVHDTVHDALTGLPNRSLFLDRMQRIIDGRHRGDKANAALIILDLDRFKMINDGLGHAAGDEALIEMARRLEQAADPANIVARLGGDEFAVLVEGEGSKKAEKAAERLLDSVAKPFAIAGQEVYAAASGGVTRIRDDHSFAEDVLREAEIAMYQAKRTGRGRIESFRPDLRAGASELLLLESDLRRAIERREIELYYQPIMFAKNGRVAGFEALLRWLHPQRGLLVADAFINVAEETGLIVALGRYALAHATEHLARWQKYYPLTHPLFVSVNISGRQLMKPEFVKDIADILSAVPIKPGTLKLEMTENVVMANPDVAVATLTRLRELGAGLALDDFGKGFSSLSYLQRYPFDTIKIDRSFVERLGDREDSKVIISSMITLAHDLDKLVVAEGVETKATADRLTAMGCDFIQGYYYGAPMSPAEAQAFIQLHWAH